jgi:DNA-directed RNA polymerase subunit K/omega
MASNRDHNVIAAALEEHTGVLANLGGQPKHSLPLMTKYELDQIIGLRATHLSKGAAPLVDVTGLTVLSNMELRRVALEELRQARLPYIIKRPLPCGEAEYVRVSDLECAHLLPDMYEACQS